MSYEVPAIAAEHDQHCGERYRLSLHADPRNFAVVRREVRAQLRLWARDELTYSAAMCVTELLSNVHKHVTSANCELTLQATPEGLRASLSDSDPTLPVVSEPDFHAERGRGLFLLAQTVDSWGAEATVDGKEVWFVLRSAADGPDVA